MFCITVHIKDIFKIYISCMTFLSKSYYSREIKKMIRILSIYILYKCIQIIEYV